MTENEFAILKDFLQKIEKRIARIEKYAMLAPREMLTLDEIVWLTGISKNSLYQQTRNKTFRAYYAGRTGNTLYINYEDVKEWIKNKYVLSHPSYDAWNSAMTDIEADKEKDLHQQIKEYINLGYTPNEIAEIMSIQITILQEQIKKIFSSIKTK